MNATTGENDSLSSEKVSVLKDLVQVAEGAIVSRVLARTGGGNITLFAFDGGQGLSEHTAPFDAIVQVIDGRLDITIAESRHNLGSGDIIRMPADVPHSLHAPESARMLLTMLRDGKSEE